MPTHWPGLHLTLGHGFQRGTHGLGAVRTLIDGKDQHRGGERLDKDANAGQAVEHDKQLHQHRRAAHDPDVKPGDLLQDGHMSKLHQRHHNGNDQRQREGNDGQRDGDGQARQQYFTKGIHKDAYKAFGHGAALSFCDAGVAGRFPTKTVCYEIVAHRHEFCKGVI